HDASTCAAIHVGARALDEPPCVRALRVSPGYFEAMGISVQGRALSWWDIDGATGAAVVSRSLASQLWPDEDPMGQGVRANGRGEPFYRVVGVVDDPRSAGLDRTAVPSVYFPIESLPDAQLWYPPRDARLVIRGASDRGPEVLAGLVRSIVTELNRDIAIGSIQPLEDIVKRSYARQTFATLLITIAGTLALGLSVVGIYGVFAYIVRQNTS